MIPCNRCKAANNEDAKFCATCGGRMEPAVAPAADVILAPEHPSMRGMAAVKAPPPEPSHPSMRGMAMVAAAEQEVRGLVSTAEQAMHAPAGTQFAVGKNPQAAILCSFFIPGGGQFYNGDMKKGLAVFAIAIFASCLTIYAGAWFLGVPLSLGTWVWGMIDAGKVARREKVMW